MRAIWSGSISFGLVNIPVKLYSAVISEKFNLDMLHKGDLSPIRYAKVCRNEGKEVPFDEIVKGVERNGEYIILEEDDFAKANVQKTSTIEIMNFIEKEEIDPSYYEKPYYLEPEKSAKKAYSILKEALEQTKKVGLAKFVLRNKEHLVLVRSFANMIILNQIRFKSELRGTDELKIPEEEVKKDELEMAKTLIDHLSKKFEPEKYSDSYANELQRIIDDKAAGKVPAIKGTIPEPTNVKDLMEMLRRSLEKEKARK